MRIHTLFAVLALFFIYFSGCTTRAVVITPRPAPVQQKRLPPGQAKKLNGDQSARAYAPGQQKKQ